MFALARSIDRGSSIKINNTINLKKNETGQFSFLIINHDRMIK